MHADASFGITSVPHSRSWRFGELRNEIGLRKIPPEKLRKSASHMRDAIAI